MKKYIKYKLLEYVLNMMKFTSHMRLKVFILNASLIKASRDTADCWDLDSLEWQQFFNECFCPAYAKTDNLVSHYSSYDPQYRNFGNKSNCTLDKNCESEPPAKRRSAMSESINAELPNPLTNKERNNSNQLFLSSHTKLAINEHPNAFNSVKQGNYSSIEDYRSNFKSTSKFFIEEFCLWDQSLELRKSFSAIDEQVIRNFGDLELSFKKALTRYAEIITNSKVHDNSVENIEKMLCRPRIRKVHHLLIYSLYESFLIGNPDAIDAIKGIMIDIIVYSCLKAYYSNEETKNSMYRNTMGSGEGKMAGGQLGKAKFEYADFTTALQHCACSHTAINQITFFVKTEILRSVRLIIEKEFKVGSAERKFCDLSSLKPPKFYQNQLLKEIALRAKNPLLLNPSSRDPKHNRFIYNNGYPSEILSFFMNTVIQLQIRPILNLKLKSVVILIHITKICLHETKNLITLLEYLMLIGSFREEYLRYEKTKQVTQEFRSMISYFFSINYLNKDDKKSLDDKSRSLSILNGVLLEYGVIFSGFNSDIRQLRLNSI